VQVGIGSVLGGSLAVCHGQSIEFVTEFVTDSGGQNRLEPLNDRADLECENELRTSIRSERNVVVKISRID